VTGRAGLLDSDARWSVKSGFSVGAVHRITSLRGAWFFFCFIQIVHFIVGGGCHPFIIVIVTFFGAADVVLVWAA